MADLRVHGEYGKWAELEPQYGRSKEEHVIEECGMGIWSWLFGPTNEHENKVDKAVDMTFPASDPVAAGKATSTEPPRRPTDRKPPLISKEDIERAQRGSGHEQN